MNRSRSHHTCLYIEAKNYLLNRCQPADIRGEYPNVTGLYGDLHSYDLSTSMWTDLSAVVRPADISIPSFPAARGAMGFAQSNGKLFIFGGLGEDGAWYCFESPLLNIL